MVIQFSVGNYKSFREIQTINFRATGLRSEDKCVDEDNIIEDQGARALRMLGVYGPNASGKSNLIKALGAFKQMVSFSQESENAAKTAFSPFRLSTRPPDHYGYFQIVLILHGRRFRYGYTLDGNANILSEWLFGPADKNETYYFTRKGNEIALNEDRFKEGVLLPYMNNLRTNALFLTFCSSYDGEISGLIKDFIAERIIIENDSRKNYLYLLGGPRELTDQLVKTGHKDIVLKWMAEAGLVFNDVSLQDIKVSEVVYGYSVFLSKNIYDDKGGVAKHVMVSMDSEESEGTKKFYSYIGGLYEVFEKGGLYVSDEMDSNFHPSLLMKIIRLFQDKKVNKAAAQLLFTSHDTNLMDPKVMRRDQFYFTEKSLTDETLIYALSDLKGIRNNVDFARQYLAGYYGAIPQLGGYLQDPEHTQASTDPNYCD